MKYFPARAIFLLILIGTIYASCEKFIDYDAPEHHPRLVVVSGFQPDETWLVDVSLSRSSFNDTVSHALEDVVVTIRSGDGSYNEELLHNQYTFLYHSLAKPMTGISYEIEVSADGYPSVYAENKIPGAATLISLDTLEGFHDGNFSNDFELTFSDPGGEDGFYIVQLYSNETYNWKDQIGNLIFIDSDDPNVEKISDDGHGSEMLFIKDQNFDGQDYTLRFYTPYYYPYEDIDAGFTVKVFSCSEEFYRFQKTTLQYQDSEGDPFAQPVQIFSNIENGIGVFGGFVVSEMEL